ncbi:MAG: hypothetical protein U5L96_04455 [Owenweeksia sp.]|nr:hypothetical protein [Owenweeksia sp.]
MIIQATSSHLVAALLFQKVSLLGKYCSLNDNKSSLKTLYQPKPAYHEKMDSRHYLFAIDWFHLWPGNTYPNFADKQVVLKFKADAALSQPLPKLFIYRPSRN